MKLLIGLGNPDKEFENTRHNAGFKFIDFIAEKLSLRSFSKQFSSLFAEIQVSGEKTVLLKPQTGMNLSGKAVQEVVHFYKLQPEQVFIAFDDLDIKEGEWKISKGHYPKVHNGVNDIINRTGYDDFNYIRIGIDGRTVIQREFMSGKDYVLQKSSFNYKEQFEEIWNELQNKLT